MQIKQYLCIKEEVNMPKALEEKLRREVNSKHPRWDKERKNAYIYGRMRATGWKPQREKK